MAKDDTKEKKYPYDMHILGYARIAAELLSQGEEGEHLAKKSLELILKDINRAEPWIMNTLTDNPQVIHKTIESQLHDYTQFKEEQTIGDLTEYYKGDFSKYLGEEGTRTAAVYLTEFVGEKYPDVNKKIAEAKHIIEGKEKFGRGSDGEVEKAKETLKRYQKVISTFNVLEGQRLSKFRARVEEEVAKENLQKLYKKEDKGKE